MVNVKALKEAKSEHIAPMSGILDQMDPDVKKHLESGGVIDAEQVGKLVQHLDPKFRMRVEEGTLRKGVDVDRHAPVVGSGSTEIKLSL